MKNMKHVWLLPAAVCGVLLLSACSESSAPEQTAETTLPVSETTTEATTTETTTTETTTVTTTTKPDYRVAEDVKLVAIEKTVRPDSCVLQISYNGAGELRYEPEFRIFNKDTGRPVPVLSFDPIEGETKTVASGNTARIEAIWLDRYGELPSGNYIYEQLLHYEDAPAEEEEEEDSEADKDSKDESSKDDSSKNDKDKNDKDKHDKNGKENKSSKADSKDDSSKEESSKDDKPKEPVKIRVVARTEFTVDEADYKPVLTVDPASVKKTGLTLHVQNSKDIGRSYGMVYRIYNNVTGELEIKQVDMDAKVGKNYHMRAGGDMTLTFNWKDTFGNLVEGEYAVEIDLLADGAEEAQIYRATFNVTD